MRPCAAMCESVPRDVARATEMCATAMTEGQVCRWMGMRRQRRRRARLETCRSEERERRAAQQRGRRAEVGDEVQTLGTCVEEGCASGTSSQREHRGRAKNRRQGGRGKQSGRANARRRRGRGVEGHAKHSHGDGRWCGCAANGQGNQVVERQHSVPQMGCNVVGGRERRRPSGARVADGQWSACILRCGRCGITLT